MRGGRLRQRRPHGSLRYQLWSQYPIPQSRRGSLCRCDGSGWCGRYGVGHRCQLWGLRPRWRRGFVRGQLRGFLSRLRVSNTLPVEEREGVLRAGGPAAGRGCVLPQQWRRDVLRVDETGWAGGQGILRHECPVRRLRQRWVARPARGRRFHAQPALSQSPRRPLRRGGAHGRGGVQRGRGGARVHGGRLGRLRQRRPVRPFRHQFRRRVQRAVQE